MNTFNFWGSGWGLVGRAVASNTRGPWFESSHWQTFIYNICLLSTVLKDENIEKEAGNSPFLNTIYFDDIFIIVLSYWNIGWSMPLTDRVVDWCRDQMPFQNMGRTWVSR